MFGYISVNRQELKEKEIDRYQQFYCGFCRCLKQQYGVLGQMTVSYDLTFLILLLSGLYEPDNHCSKSHCVLHPVAGRQCISNEFTRYCADMNVMLTYFKCLDDWEDERKAGRYMISLLLKGKTKQVQQLYKQKAAIIYDNLQALHECEKNDIESPGNVDAEIAQNMGRCEKPEYTIDTAAGYFGRIMEELFVYRKDEWEPVLRQMGFYLGKFLYLMDAYEDMEHDVKTGNYNPVLKLYRQMYKGPRNQVLYFSEFEEKIHDILQMMMAQSARCFERLPIIEEASILRNILYSGVWYRYEMVADRRREATIKKEEKASRQ